MGIGIMRVCMWDVHVHGAEMEGIGEVSVHADIHRLTEPMMWTPRILS